MCNRGATHTMTIELHYKLHSQLMPVICTVNNIGLAGLSSECVNPVSLNSMQNNVVLWPKIGQLRHVTKGRPDILFVQ